MPTFSIVLPTYNRGSMLLEALESVLAQSVASREVIVVDDGSTDRTPELLEPYRNRIRYVRIANAGPAAAKNRGAQLADGELIGFLDSDDLWEPDTLAAVSDAFEQDPEVGFVSIMAREIASDGRRTERVYGKKSPGPFYSTGSLLSSDSGGCSWFFLRSKVLDELGGFDESLRSAEECDLFLRCSLITRMVAVRQPLLLRRAHDDNLSSDMLLNARCWIRLLEKFRREHPEAVRRNRWSFRRAMAKERLRLGRELLVHRAGEAAIGCDVPALPASVPVSGLVPDRTDSVRSLAWAGAEMEKSGAGWCMIRRWLSVGLVASLVLTISCRPDVLIRLATHVYHDGSMERQLDVRGFGRPDSRDGSESDEESHDDDWLETEVGLQIAEPGSWSRIETGADWLRAEGFFRSTDDLPPLLSFATGGGRRTDRVRTTLDIDDKVVLKRWRYLERHADPFSSGDALQALDALIGLVHEALDHELKRQFGEDFDTRPAELFLKQQVKGLATALISVGRQHPGIEHRSRRISLWADVLSQHDIPVRGSGEDDSFWEAQAPVLSAWMRSRIAAALSTTDQAISPRQLTFWPSGDDMADEALELVARVWSDEEEFEERVLSHIAAISGYYGSSNSPRFRFESRVQLPGTLLRTNGTPAGDSVLWIFRPDDLTFGELVLRAESVEPQRHKLSAMGARKNLDHVQIVQLADLLWKRDPDGVLVDALGRALVDGRLNPLLDEDEIPAAYLERASELVGILDPDTEPPPEM